MIIWAKCLIKPLFYGFYSWINNFVAIMAYFHYRCGERITLINENTTAIRNDSEFDHGLVISAEPLMNDVLFEVIIDRKVTFCYILWGYK